MVGLIVRFIVSALVLLFTGYIIPGFEIVGFINALLAAVAIAVIGYLIEQVLGRRVAPQSRGIVGFLSAAAVIWAIQFIIPAVRVTIVGALLASLVIGIVDAFVPTELR